MRPRPSPKPLIRVGGSRDGAYLLPDDLEGVSACFSPGVSGVKHFEDELLAVHGIPSHMCDFSSDVAQFKTPLATQQTFRKLWLDIQGRPDSMTLEDWVAELSPGSDDLLLQMDIEGAEYRNLLSVPEVVLKRFRIIVVELHRLAVCQDESQFQRELGPLLKRLDKHFVCVHAHPNNCEGEFKVPGTNLNLPRVHELTFLRRDRFKGRRSSFHPPQLPHPLDISQNNRGRPPVFMNEHWLEGERSVESQLKLVNDRLVYESQRLQLSQTALKEAELIRADIQDLLGGEDLNLQNKSRPELAQDRAFVVSSRHASCPGLETIQARRPYFFHTKMERQPYITIDLGRIRVLDSLVIVNRADGFSDRARQLRFCLHKTLEPDFDKARPVWVTKAFQDDPGLLCQTRIGGERARYLTIFSPAFTFLHFSAVRIYGRARAKN